MSPVWNGLILQFYQFEVFSGPQSTRSPMSSRLLDQVQSLILKKQHVSWTELCGGDEGKIGMQPCCGVQQSRFLRLHLWMQQQMCWNRIIIHWSFIQCTVYWLRIVMEDPKCQQVNSKHICSRWGMQVATAVFIYFFTFYHLFNDIMFKSMYVCV